ncbi:MAG: DUF1289 domain-containing protein [Casimicrobiaceae bacterium]
MEDADVPSPCISVCVLDRATGWCTGCLRTIDEIATWGNLDNPSRRAVIDQLPSRTRALKDRRHGND